MKIEMAFGDIGAGFTKLICDILLAGAKVLALDELLWNSEWRELSF